MPTDQTQDNVGQKQSQNNSIKDDNLTNINQWQPAISLLVVVVTIVPIMILSLSFAYLHVSTRLNDLERNTLHHAQATLQTLAATTYQYITQPLAELAEQSASPHTANIDLIDKVSPDLKAQLQVILNQAMMNTHIRAVSLHRDVAANDLPSTPHSPAQQTDAFITRTASFTTLLHAGPPMLPPIPDRAQNQRAQHLLTHANWQYPQQQIRYTGSTYRLETSVLPASSNPLRLFMEVEADLSRLTAKQYEIIATGVTIAIIGGIISILTGVLLNTQLRRPMQRLEQRLNTLTEGDLHYTPENHLFAEWAHLEQSIHRMVQSLKHEHDELQQSASQATEDLRQTLETIEIQNVELDFARKKALEASRVKSEFLANISHEIRTPLNGIIGFTKLLLKTPLASKHREYLSTIHKSSEGLLTIINDILDFSKIEAGKLALEHISFDLRETIEDALTMVSPMAHEKKLELINLFFAEPSTPLLGDPLRIKQVVTNLVNNAIKFTDHGCITVRTTTESANNQYLVLKVSVTDTGIGLTDAEQSNLFKAFSQGDASSARKYGGTGLGLVICKHLVQQMCGDVGFHSEYQTGSTFWFTLQLAINQNAPQSLSESTLARRRILVFDSNALVRLSLRNSLESSQLLVEEVDSLNAIFSHLDPERHDAKPIDAVILGRAQEHLSASEISDLVHLIEDQYHRKCIVLCTTHERYLLQSKLNLTPSQILSKPVPQPKLYAALEHALLENALLAPTQDVEHSSFLHQHSPDELETSETQKVHALCVDDNPSNLTLIRALLEDIGVRVTTCDNGVKALEAIGKTTFDIIFMDIQMPRMDGVETTRKIRALESEDQTPIVALTAHALPSEKQGLFKAGMNEYITKPMQETQLIHILKKHTHYQPVSNTPPTSTREKPATNTANLLPIRVTPQIKTHQHSAPSSAPSHTRDAYRTSSNAAGTSTDSDRKPVFKRRKEAVPTLRHPERTQTPVFDPAEHLRLSNHKEDLAEQLLSILIRSLGPTQQALQSAWENEDYAALLEHTHKLHGATHYCGVPALRQALYQLETLIKQRNISQLPNALRHALDQIGRLRTALTRREPDPVS